MIKNIYIYDILKLEITARAFDGEKKIAEETYKFFPKSLRPNDILPFQIRLKAGDYKSPNLRFFYRYYGISSDEYELQFGSF